ncbi:hypothetical protein FSP39_018465 [Pinctada imbricata]|uniref:B box-type domain-containing protein n=1 Tax=Pinctada imbricata TaxID=66713 RepID=A0AA88XTF6_PINIB|nr:hypothetical protein FSP39_018465 [Pinctada imbricata]
MSDHGASAKPPQQTFVECGECGGNMNVVWFCKNCPISLCGKCARSHKTKHQYKFHAVVPRTYTVLRLYGPAKLAEQCHIHPEKEISTYCNDCDIPCCVSCLANDHNRHDFSTIEDKYLDAEKVLNEYYRLLDTDVRPTIENMEEQAKADVKEDDSHVQKVLNDINDFRKDVVQNFNRACDELIIQVKKSQSKGKERLDEIEKYKKNLVTLKHEIEEKIEKGDLDIVKYVPPKVESLIPELKITQNTVQWFEPDKRILDMINASVGVINFKEIKKEETKGIKDVNVQNKNSFKSKIKVASMTTAGNNMAWVMYCWNHTMYLYNDEGKVVRSVTVKDGVGIIDMSITQSGEMIVTCGDNKVRRVSVSGEVSTKINTAPFGCSGVCLTDEEEIVVCMRDQGDKNHVAIYSHDGRCKVREIRAVDGQGNQLLTKPYRVVLNDLDLNVVNAFMNVVSISCEGDVRWVYDGKQAKIKRPFDPSGICVDKYRNLLVSDLQNHCVHYIDRKGGLIQVIMTLEQTGLQRPFGICVDDVTRHVWVGNANYDVVIARYLKLL